MDLWAEQRLGKSRGAVTNLFSILFNKSWILKCVAVAVAVTVAIVVAVAVAVAIATPSAANKTWFFKCFYVLLFFSFIFLLNIQNWLF